MTYIVSSGALNFTHSLTHCQQTKRVEQSPRIAPTYFAENVSKLHVLENVLSHELLFSFLAILLWCVHFYSDLNSPSVLWHYWSSYVACNICPQNELWQPYSLPHSLTTVLLAYDCVKQLQHVVSACQLWAACWVTAVAAMEVCSERARRRHSRYSGAWWFGLSSICSHVILSEKLDRGL